MINLRYAALLLNHPVRVGVLVHRLLSAIVIPRFVLKVMFSLSGARIRASW
jgi:hypothetical protein